MKLKAVCGESFMHGLAGEVSDGNISIDGLNTSTIGLMDLRRRLAIIPQDAALFAGTVRDNLDPGHTRDDTELWNALGAYLVHADKSLWRHDTTLVAPAAAWGVFKFSVPMSL